MKPSVWCETQRVSIRVTAMHIATGRFGDCYACPIALALSETLGGEWAVSDFSINELTTGFQVSLPSAVARFIADFDQCRPVLPFTFDLNLPLALVPKALLPGPFTTARKCGF